MPQRHQPDMLGAGHGTKLKVKVEGPDAQRR